MSQILSQVPRHLLQQQQRLTPQLIQAMDILQLNTLALEERIAQELDANPALELAPPDDEAGEPAASPADASADERPDGEQALKLGDEGRDFERLDNLVREYDWLEDEGARPGLSRSGALEAAEAKMEAMANTAARPISLQEHLTDQWNLTEVDDETRRLGAFLIENLDESGRLPVALEALAAQLAPPASVERLADALARIQQLDPPGVAARSLQECLLLQLEALPDETDLEQRIVEEHFEDLQKNRLPQIAAALEVDLEAVKAALERIRRLSLHPGLDVVARGAPPVVPDVIVEHDPQEDRYRVRLARANQRELRLSPEFRALLERARDNKQMREFARQKLDAAAAIIDAVKYRNERLLDVARAVVDAQRDFLDRGEQHIKVLRMSDLAARFGCDPSTISRTVDEKWVQTPRGIYPLRRFFTGGTESGDGEALGWDSIKAKVQEIVQTEDKTNPLSDDEIVKRLADQGIDIKRRTVAKYRSQLGIPTARQRRVY